jgi:starch-binding outer membrane protein, SusD/RagB family
MKSILNKIALLYITLTFVSCYDLELPSSTELNFDEAAKSTLSVDGIINGGYGRMMSIEGNPQTNGSMFHMILYAEAMGNKNTFYSSAGSANATTGLMHNFNMPESNGVLQTVSRNLYGVVAMANNVIEIVNERPPLDLDFPNQKNRLLGEAYFLRATAFFTMARFWAHQYGVNNTAANSGIMIPIKRSTDGTVGVGRATLEDTYKQIIQDLTEASNLLPTSYNANVHSNYPAYRFRANKAAALAMLAKVYFQQGTTDGYEKALTNINKVIGSTPGSIVGTPETENRVYTLQTLVSAPFNSTGFVLPGNNSEEILRLVLNNSPTQGYSAAALQLTNESGGNPTGRNTARWFLKRPNPNPAATTVVTTSSIFDSIVGDRRFTELTENINPATTVGNQRVSKKWGFQIGTAIGQNNLPLLRSAELVITRAEIQAVLGNLQGAVDDYNLIRRRAITNYKNRLLSEIGGGTQAAVIAEIVKERQRELLMEGDDFWAWKRMGAFNQTKANTYPANEVASFTKNGVVLNWNSNKTLLKYHTNDLLLNPLLGVGAQNPD